MTWKPTFDSRLLALLDAISGTTALHAAVIRERLYNDPRVDSVPSQRTIERDLEKLATEYPLTRIVKRRKVFWRWDGETLREQVTRMTPEHAYTLLLVRKHLQHQLPADVAAGMQPYFERAEKVIVRSRFCQQLANQPAGNDESPAGDHRSAVA